MNVCSTISGYSCLAISQPQDHAPMQGHFKIIGLKTNLIDLLICLKSSILYSVQAAVI